MKFQFYAIATFSAVMTTVGINPIARAIVAVDQTTLTQSQVVPGQFSGVVGLFQLDASTSFCTGSLLPGGWHILTAAHCLEVREAPQDSLIQTQPSFVSFNLGTGNSRVPVSTSFIFPEWNGLVGNGNDIAVLLLAEPAPSTAQQYDVYRDTDEIGQTFTKVGYGRVGTGDTGYTDSNGLTAYLGQNQFEATESARPDLLLSPGVPLSQLLYDFDNGRSSNNLFGSLGLGTREVNVAPGDSGGPAFIGDRIAGITSYGATSLELPTPTDIDLSLNASFGEFAGDARVSTYASFIDDILARTTPSRSTPESVPEPSTLLGMMTSGIYLWKWRRKRSNH